MIRVGFFAAAVVLSIALLFLFLTAAKPARAHEWYEAACCSGQDCKPVPDGTVTETDHGVEIKGWGVISETDPRIRWSQDDQDHLCVRPPGPAFYGNFAAKPKLMCVYRKRKFM